MRADGKRIKDANPIYTVACHIMDKRNDAMNMIEVDLPLRPMNEYIRQKHREGLSITHLTLVLTAYLHAAAQFPLINRFIVNKKIYARREFSVAMVVLKPDEEDGTINKMYFHYEDTLFDVHKKLTDYIEENRHAGDTNSTDRAVRTLLGIPGLLRGGVGLCKFLDKHGWLPYSLIKSSPFHCSLVITNLASIRTNHIFHHCYNFGTTGVAVALGNPREVAVRTADGVGFVRCLPLGVVMDERLCSGSYYAKFFHLIKHYLKHPELLENVPENIIYETPFR